MNDRSEEKNFIHGTPQDAGSQGPHKRLWDKLTGEKTAKWIEAFAKVAAAGAIVFGAIIAKNYESKISAMTILTQREQAESDLRASMFSHLITPIIGPLEGKSIPHPDRERLLVELLALNFHEYFELKPLMVHVDRRLAAGQADGMTTEEIKAARKSLRSIAGRVADRQTAQLMKECMWKKKGLKHPYTVLINIMDPAPMEAKKMELSKPPNHLVGQLNDIFEITSPDGTYSLTIVVYDPDWEQQAFKVQIATNFLGPESSEINHRETSIAPSFDFNLTRFDFPFTDNTLLANGNRFAMVIDNVSDLGTQKSLVLMLIWFPKDYFTSRERPINYSEFREKLGIKAGSDS